MTDPNAEYQLYKATAPDSLPALVESLLTEARENNQVVVLATGVFDLLHQEHVAFLTKARAIGDILIVGVESDSRVKELKGDARPIHSDLQRRRNIDKLKLADAVFILPDAFSTPEDYSVFTHHLRPNILAVSSHTNFQERKQQLMSEVGGKVVVVHEHNPKISTSILLAQKSSII